MPLTDVENKPTFEHLKKRLNEIENEASNILKSIRKKSQGNVEESEATKAIAATPVIQAK